MASFLFVFFFVICPVAMALVACVLLALWLAFGRTNLFIRMPAFLLGTLPIGFVFCLAERHTTVVLVVFFLIVGLIAGVLSRLHIAIRVSLAIPLLFIVGMFVCYPPAFDWRGLNTAWIVRLSFGTSILAAWFAALRLFGFNVVGLVSGTNDLEVEQHTGRGLDRWIQTINQANGANWNHAEIMAFLRSFGMDFSWQKRITLAYEKTLGRWTVGRSPDGGLQVVSQSNPGKGKWSQGFSFERIGIWQLMLLTFCVACLFRFTRAASPYLPTTQDMAVGIPFSISVSIVAISLLVSCLAVGKVRKNTLVLTLFFLGVVCFSVYGIQAWLGFRSGIFLPAFASFVFAFTCMMIGVLVQARHKGYRLVRVQHVAKPKDSVIRSVGQWEQLRDASSSPEGTM